MDNICVLKFIQYFEVCNPFFICPIFISKSECYFLAVDRHFTTSEDQFTTSGCHFTISGDHFSIHFCQSVMSGYHFSIAGFHFFISGFHFLKTGYNCFVIIEYGFCNFRDAKSIRKKSLFE